MKKIIIILLLLFVFSIIFGQTFTKLYTEFKIINSYHKTDDMKKLLETLSSYTDDASVLAIYCNALTEYANWGVEKDKKEQIYEKAVEIGKKAVEMDPNNGYAHYALGAAIGRLAQYKGIVSSLFMLGDFDEHISKAIKLDPKLYTAYIAMGMRYRDVPWPLNNYKKSEEFLLKAAAIEPNYVNAYYELGILYKTWKKYDKAKEMFNKVIKMPLHPDWVEQGKESKELSKKELENLK
ncbi:TPR repeat-containing protein [Marinitoga hydrogenitolerans DSM 16785]|uniref:TPR repeat-containing protein n=1 Tax=Marinitoga hydrogenitolerans (strain DSM 16785 / JCM 12826 / AT1271) TaxID=1122195 RepID=A0A1M4TWV8_MARH1|nr:tetratricopeptide repeat protein [Marinitoga hydrogenitolerans]SHE48864.1 TPR repeat-containing protein [Marinitoga hydrogenitolerans DSM 16785]